MAADKVHYTNQLNLSWGRFQAVWDAPNSLRRLPRLPAKLVSTEQWSIKTQTSATGNLLFFYLLQCLRDRRR